MAKARVLAAGDVVEGESFDSFRSKLSQAISEAHQGNAWLRDVYSNGAVIFEWSDSLPGSPGRPSKLMKTTYIYDARTGKFSFTPDVEVKQVYVEAEEVPKGDVLELAEDTPEQKAQKARAKQYGIQPHGGGNVTKPTEWKDVPDAQFLDPVNYAYPCPDAAQTGTAAKYWGQAKNKAKYSEDEQTIIDARAEKMKKKFKIGEYAEQEPTETGREVRSLMILELEDGKAPSEIPLHMVGKWNHPVYGQFEMTEAMMDTAIGNFSGCAYRPNAPADAQVAVDEQHAGGEANGWLTRMYRQGQLLMGDVAWTERGKKLIMDKRYRFISPAYSEDFEGKGTTFKEVTLTNRPFLRELPAIGQAVLLSEDVARDAFLTPDSVISGSEANKGGTRDMGKETENPGTPGIQITPPAPATFTLSEAEYKAMQVELAKGKDLQAEVEKGRQLTAKLELEAKSAQIEAAVKAAGARGVDAFTLNWAKAIMLQASRDGVADMQLDSAKPDKANLFGAVLKFLEQVPATVPLGERTKSHDNPPPAGGDVELSEDDKKQAKTLAAAAGAEMKATEKGD